MFRILLREYERFIGFSRTIHVREIRLFPYSPSSRLLAKTNQWLLEDQLW
mgnify:CR=1 FL=1